MRPEVLEAVYRAVDEVNEQLPKERRLEKSIHTLVLARGTSLDSLQFVNLVTATEHEIERRFGANLDILAEHLPSPDEPSFATLGSLAKLATEQLERRGQL